MTFVIFFYYNSTCFDIFLFYTKEGDSMVLIFKNLFILICIEALLVTIYSFFPSSKKNYRNNKVNDSFFKVSHEIKNSIAVCKGYLEIMNKEQLSNQYIDILTKEIDKTLLIINDYSKFGKLSLNIELIDIYYLIEEVIFNYSTIMNKNSIKLLNKKNIELFIMVDYIKIKQVLTNMIKNSYEAKSRRKISIVIEVINKLKNIHILIKDNGVGMDKYTISKINDMFYTTKDDGVGLGVVYSNEIIKLHGGNIKYKSIFGKGTTVSIIIPKQLK